MLCSLVWRSSQIGSARLISSRSSTNTTDSPCRLIDRTRSTAGFSLTFFSILRVSSCSTFSARRRDRA